MRRFKVITLCGSTRFKEDYIRVQKELTLAGNIVISVGLFGHQGDDEVWEEGVKEIVSGNFASAEIGSFSFGRNRQN